MLAMSWEVHAAALANAPNDAFEPAVVALCQELALAPESWARAAPADGTESPLTAHAPVVYVGHDTRPSCPRLVACLHAGVVAAGGVVICYGPY
jgi:phosphomannomutase